MFEGHDDRHEEEEQEPLHQHVHHPHVAVAHEAHHTRVQPAEAIERQQLVQDGCPPPETGACPRALRPWMRTCP